MIKKKYIYLCAINNIESGTCNEDCKFCTQSTKHKAIILRYKRKNIQDIVDEAKMAKKNKAIGYCLVTAGLGLTDDRLEFVTQAAYAIKKEVSDINLIACNGIASIEQLKELKKAGISRYNHNLETSQSFYKDVCTTHLWEDRYLTCQNVHSAGLGLVCGGILGMGESNMDRISMFNSIASLNPKTVPLNFFHPNEALPMVHNTLNIHIAFDLIKKAKQIINPEKLMVAGGREITFKNYEYDIFKYGANSIVIGDYLTTSGNKATKDIKELEKLGFEISTSCDK
ncbi:Biotin synthase [hydrothermal vent metagenome]|uniref:biotin synthase n=1 Tax=hydrothermal vent metagenome TaxID=652676 RepID=A0A3B1DWX2_9ZZZZ